MPWRGRPARPPTAKGLPVQVGTDDLGLKPPGAYRCAPSGPASVPLPLGSPPPCSPPHPGDNFKPRLLELRVPWNPIPPSPSSHYLLPSPYSKPTLVWVSFSRTALGEPFHAPICHPGAVPLRGAHEMPEWGGSGQWALTQAYADDGNSLYVQGCLYHTRGRTGGSEALGSYCVPRVQGLLPRG